jgi:TPR repeat protein
MTLAQSRWFFISAALTLLLQSEAVIAQQSGNDVSSPEQQTKALKLKAESGDAKSQVDLGIVYATGDGLPADETEAIKWFRKAAEQRNAAGEYALGEMYSTGRGVAVDYIEALKWLRRSAEQGDARGQYNLAAMYSEGKGVAKDHAESAKWLKKAAEQGFAAGQFGLGVMYAHGRGVPQDDAEAVRWYRRAMEQGELSAANNLALLLATSKDAHLRSPDEAVGIALKLVDSDPQEPIFLDTLAVTYYEAGQHEKAAKTEKKALALNPNKAVYKDALQKYLSSIKH